MHNYRKVHSKFLPRSIKHFQINSLNISNQFKFNLNRIYQFWLVSHDRSMKIKILHWTFCRHARCHHPKNKSIIYSFLANNNKNIENNKNINVVKVSLLEFVRSIRKRTEITCHTRYLSFSPIKTNQNLEIGAIFWWSGLFLFTFHHHHTLRTIIKPVAGGRRRIERII